MAVNITFGIIVLNGEPFILYNLRSLYPFAHQIVVVEGACRPAAGVATPDGHSRDGTLEALKKFKAESDPENKMLLVTAEQAGHPDGFWSEKDEMSQAYATRATGNYLWQIDGDEFYTPEGIRAAISVLESNPTISGMSVRAFTFWASLRLTIDNYVFQTGEQRDIERIFAWKPGYTYATHRPPTVVDEQGRNLKSLNWMSAKRLAAHGVNVWHYPLLFPKQVEEKCAYYAKLDPNKFYKAEKWAVESYTNLRHPFHVSHIMNEVSWLNHYKGTHPPQVLAMVEEVARGGFKNIRLRGDDDAIQLMSSFSYRLKRLFLIAMIPVVLGVHHWRLTARPLLHKTPIWRLMQRAKAFVGGRLRYQG